MKRASERRRQGPINPGTVFSPVGAVLAGLGVALGLCGAVGEALDRFDPPALEPREEAVPLLVMGAGVLALGLAIYATGRNRRASTVSRREATLAVALIWLSAGICGALPFVFGAQLSPIDAFFESVSGLTTTGATVIPDVEETLSRPLLLWRSLIQWLGGMGIVVLFVAVFPNVGAGGKHMFRGEVPGTTAEGLKPRIAETSFTLWRLYTTLTVAEIGVLVALRMDPFEAVCHALTTMSTGGFSTRNESIAAFGSPAIELAIAGFMYIGSINYGLYYGALRGRSLRGLVSDVELRSLVALALVSILVLAVGILGTQDATLAEALRRSFFMVGTTLSSTGYGIDDYMAYPSAALGTLVFLMFVGGSAGSTAGGIKVERVVLMLKQAWRQVGQFFRPNVIRVVRMGRRVVDDRVLADVAAFFIVYAGCMVLCVIAIAALENTPLPTAFGATLTCLSNMGPAPFYLEADNFAEYGAFSKTICAFAMLLGRLEFFTLLSLLLPGFWKT